MLSPWALEEMNEADLGDKRLNERLRQIVSNLGERPTASIPAACGGHAELTAAYRFFDNERVTPENILAPHFAMTRQRIAAQEVALFVQDTSEIDVTRPKQKVAGAGPLDRSSRRGAFLHLMEAFSVDGVPLGAVWCDIWARDEASLELSAEEKRRQRKEAPIEEKESYRWIQGVQQVRDVAQAYPEVKCIAISDSESDIYELFIEPRGEINPVHWLVRFCQDRAVLKSEDSPAGLIRQRVLEAPVLFSHQIHVRGRTAKISCEKRGRRQPRKDRDATVEVRATSMTLRPPSRPGMKLATVTVNVVMVREVDPPPDDEPIEWILITTLPIDSLVQVREIIQYYCTRWMIEVFFKTLKSGCRVEERRFEALDRLSACLAVYLIVAWRTLFVCRMGQTCPDMDCETIFEPSEWKSVWVAVHREKPPKKPPTLKVMVRLIAQLGGYVNRTNRKDPPGPQTVWLGLQRMRDLAWGWDTFGPGANK